MKYAVKVSTHNWDQVTSVLSLQYCFDIEVEIYYYYISSSYANILEETNFCTREIPQSGSKAEDVEKRKKEEEKSR